MSEYNFIPLYPKLELDLETPEGRRRCHDELCLHSLKRYQFEQYVGSRVAWFNDKARKRLFLMHINMNTYKVLQEAYFGKQEDSTNFEALNNSLEKQTIFEIIDKLGSYLRSKQEKALLEPPPYN